MSDFAKWTALGKFLGKDVSGKRAFPFVDTLSDHRGEAPPQDATDENAAILGEFTPHNANGDLLWQQTVVSTSASGAKLPPAPEAELRPAQPGGGRIVSADEIY